MAPGNTKKVSLNEKASHKVHIISYDRQQELDENEVHILEQVRGDKRKWIHGLYLNELEHSSWGDLAQNLSRERENKRETGGCVSTRFFTMACQFDRLLQLSPFIPQFYSFLSKLVQFSLSHAFIISWDTPVMLYTPHATQTHDAVQSSGLSSTVPPSQPAFPCLQHNRQENPSFISKDYKFRHWQVNIHQVPQNQIPQVNPFLLKATVC